MSGVCDYCGTDLPITPLTGKTWSPADLGEAVWAINSTAEHYRQHIEELLTEIERAGEGEWDGIPGLVIPDSWHGPRIQQLRGDNT